MNTRSWTGLLVSPSLILCLTSGAIAQKSVESISPARQAPGVYVSLEGETAGSSIAVVLTELLKNPADLPTESHLTVPGDTVCRILDKRGYPPPCEAMLPVLDSLNDRLRPLASTPLKLNTNLTLPKIDITRSSAIRVFSKNSADQRSTANNLLTHWQGQRIEPNRPSDAFAVRYNSHEFVIGTETDTAAREVFQRLAPLRSKNILITPLVLESEDPKLNSGAFPTAAAAKTHCENGSLKERGDRYFDLMVGDQDALPHIKGRPEPASVPVYVIDTTLHPLPTAPAQPPANPSPWSCPWSEFVKSLHHATHIAGLIRSKGKPHFFEGLSPNASIESFPWWKPDDTDPTKLAKSRPDRDIALRQLFNDNFEGPPVIPVYLAAIQFERYAAFLADGQLQSADKRHQGRPLETAIVQARPLLITAAGQPERDEEPPAPLSPTSPRSPQNMGDFENVVVVTACKVCSGPNPSLYDRANYSVPGYPMVHVAAPGGEPIPGWISDKHIGAAGGTSQAAALVAGVAASMIGSFPGSYTEASRVKKRLQLTSRPLPPQPDGTAHPSARNLTGGIVDPVLALLDPTKHWMREGGVWKAVKLRRWSGVNLMLRDSWGHEMQRRVSEIIRLVKTRPASDSSQSDLWTMMIDARKSHGAEAGEVDRRDLIQQISGAQLVLCDGSSKSVDKYEDIIFAMNGIQTNECTTN